MNTYANFKGLVTQRNLLDQWHAFEEKTEEQALREWCAEKSITVIDDETPGLHRPR
jgi:hypothetical protein